MRKGPNKEIMRVLALSSRTDFSVDMSGQISSRRRHLSTKQLSGNKCGDVPTKIQTSNYAMDHRNWPGKQRLAEHQACRCTHLQRFSQTVKPFWRHILSIFCFLNESFLFQNSTLCWQNRIFVDRSHFLKIAVLSPILSTKRLSTTALASMERKREVGETPRIKPWNNSSKTSSWKDLSLRKFMLSWVWYTGSEKGIVTVVFGKSVCPPTSKICRKVPIW